MQANVEKVRVGDSTFLCVSLFVTPEEAKAVFSKIAKRNVADLVDKAVNVAVKLRDFVLQVLSEAVREKVTAVALSRRGGGLIVSLSDGTKIGVLPQDRNVLQQLNLVKNLLRDLHLYIAGSLPVSVFFDHPLRYITVAKCGMPKLVIAKDGVLFRVKMLIVLPIGLRRYRQLVRKKIAEEVLRLLCLPSDTLINVKVRRGKIVVTIGYAELTLENSLVNELYRDMKLRYITLKDRLFQKILGCTPRLINLIEQALLRARS